MRAAIALVALCAASALLSAQTPAPPQGPDQPTFRAGVTLVTTDAIPRDPDGRFVPDLAKDDFVVLEDGVEQKIESFVLVHGGRTFNLLQAPSQVIVPEGIVLPPTEEI